MPNQPVANNAIHSADTRRLGSAKGAKVDGADGAGGGIWGALTLASVAGAHGAGAEACHDGDMTDSAIRMYGADWCSDCRRTKKQLDDLAVDYAYIDVEADAAAATEAQGISGRTNIPVVVYPDGTHHVEPSNTQLEAKLRELSLL